MYEITGIEVQKNNNKRVNVYVNSEYAFSCDMEIVYRQKIIVKSQIDLNYVSQIVDEDNFIKAKNYALRTIERVYKTEKEVYTKLIKKGFEVKIIDKVMEFLRTYDFVDDEKYVHLFINEKIKGMGRNKIIYNLKSKGIKDNIIESEIQDIDTTLEYDSAEKLAVKKYNILVKSENDTKKVRQKLSQYLAYRGYSWDLINKVASRIFKEQYFDEE